MSADKKATTAPVAWPREADPLTQALQRLNSIPYNITKSECIEVLRHLRADLSAPPAAARVPLTDEQIDALMPAADGTAEVNVQRLEVLLGIMGTEYEEADAWRLPLVRQVVRAAIKAAGQEGGAA